MPTQKVSYDLIVKHAESKYSLAIALAKRARQIHDGAEVLVDSDSEKPVTLALAEFASGCLGYGLENSRGEVDMWPEDPGQLASEMKKIN